MFRFHAIAAIVALVNLPSFVVAGDNKFKDSNLRFNTGGVDEHAKHHKAANNNNNNNLERDLLVDMEGLSGCWGSWMQDGFCLEKVLDTTSDSSDKIKFLTCDNNKPKQMWKLIYPEGDYYTDDDEHFFDRTFMLKNMDGGCMGVVSDGINPKVGTNVKVFECNRNDPQQHWMSGDTLFLRDRKDLCVSPDITHYPLEKDRTAVVLRDCEGVDSWDGYP